MKFFLLLLLILISVCIFVEGLLSKQRIYQFPFLASAVFLGFIDLPLLGLVSAHDLPQWGFERYTIMALLSLVAIWFGDRCGRRISIHNTRIRVDNRKWLIGSSVLVSLGFIAFIRFRNLLILDESMVTGASVAANFFVQLLRYGFIMAALAYLSKRNIHSLLLLTISLVYYLHQIVLLARRQILIEFVFVLMAVLWLRRGIMVSRVLVLIGFFLLIIAINSTGEYRSTIINQRGDFYTDRFSEMNWIENVKERIMQGSAETVAAIYYMSAIAKESVYDFGIGHWNAVVSNYVPAQIFGMQFKQSLYFYTPDPGSLAFRFYSFGKDAGTTVTGMVDCFHSFGYFGVIKFFLIALVMRILFTKAVYGSMMAQAIYIFMMTMALHTITHGTYWFVSPWIHVAIFWLPLLRWTTIKPSAQRQIYVYKTASV